MAGNASNYLERVQLARSVGQADYVIPTGTVIALYTTSPTDAGGGVEVSGGSYVRQPIVWGPPTTDGSGNTTIANTNTIIFPTATAPWGAILAGGIFDLNSTPNLLYWGPITPPKNIYLSDVFEILPGQIIIGND